MSLLGWTPPGADQSDSSTLNMFSYPCNRCSKNMLYMVAVIVPSRHTLGAIPVGAVAMAENLQLLEAGQYYLIISANLKQI